MKKQKFVSEFNYFNNLNNKLINYSYKIDIFILLIFIIYISIYVLIKTYISINY